MDPFSALAGLAIGIGGPFAALLAARRWAHPDAVAGRRARRVERVAVEALRDGVLARVRGRARRLDETLEAPLSGRDCVAWSVELRSRAGTEADVIRLASPDWDLVARRQGGAIFLVDDGTGVPRREAGAPSEGGYRGADDRWVLSRPDDGAPIVVATPHR